ncbi:MAG: asparagine synthetase B [Methanobacteriaceae archaeon]|nr:asparagine synthetase B [Methanobacteriaceae archaeon]
MCGIAAIIGENAHLKLYDMLHTLQHRGPDGTGAWVDGNLVYGDLSEIDIPPGFRAIGHNLLSIVGDQEKQPLISGNIILTCNGEIYNYHELRFELEKDFDYDFITKSDSEVISALINIYYDGKLSDCIPPVLERLDGDYAFVAYDGKDLVAVRDPVGVKPIYYGSNDHYLGLASERKALQKVGINDTHSLPPNYMLHNQELVSLPERFSWKDGLSNSQLFHQSHQKSQDEIKKSTDTYGKYPGKNYLKKILRNMLIKSVEKRVRGLENIGILFSGGVDSTILAVLCADLGVHAELYAVGSEGSSDLKFAEKIAEHMHLPIHITKVDEKMVREYTPLVLNAIEEWNLMKLGVGMTAYLAAAMANEDGFRVMLSGQGADELFAGYHRYLNFYHEKGEEAQEDLKGDVENLYHVNLERDDKVTMARSVELRVPYLDLDIINLAMLIPMKYKICGQGDALRKRILREVALDLGVPNEVVKRPKKAAQYGSGIDKILRKKIIKDHHYMDQLKKSFKFIDI